ncbi:MAG: cyclophilin-like fold protein [Hyphomicrobium aestuarii]|nr:cyclophilin-like fold protein [Hyphomicrobium aestuarii]
MPLNEGRSMREIVIRVVDIAIRARLLDTPTADRIWAALPIYAEARTWGHEVYFDTVVASPIEPDAKAVIRPGEITFWPEGGAIAIGFGPTPISQMGEIRLAGASNVWAEAVDDVSQLRAVHAGERIAILQADS